MSYADLYFLGILRKKYALGPIGMYKAMLNNYMGKPISVINEGAEKPEDRKKIEWATPLKIFNKLKSFWSNYGVHRNKMTILTPGIHTTDYSPDDNRFDLRPFLYPAMGFSYQLNVVNDIAKKDEANREFISQYKTGIHLDTFNKFKAYETTLESLKRAEKGPAAESGSGGAARAEGGSRRHHLTRRKGVGKKSKQTRHSKK